MDIKQFESLNIDDEATSRRSSDASDATTLIASPKDQPAVLKPAEDTASPDSLSASPGYRMIVPPKQGRDVKKLATIADLPYELLEMVISHISTESSRYWAPAQRKFKNVPDKRRQLFYSRPTNDLLNLMRVSKTLNQVAGVNLYSRLCRIDLAEGALRTMTERKAGYLIHGQSINMGLSTDTNGLDRASIPIRNLHLRVTRTMYYQPFSSPAALQFVPRTLVLWLLGPCKWDTSLADKYHAYQVKNLVVRVGKPSAWEDYLCNIRTDKTWFSPFVRTKSVVFIVDNTYEMYTAREDRRRDVRYNPEDNLHPWVSLFKRSLLEYSLDPDYAKDITIVNIGSIRSETLGLADEYLSIEADFKCEKCYAQNEFEKLFMTDYENRLSQQTGQVDRADFKFIPFCEYLRTYNWRDTLSKHDEEYYLRHGSLRKPYQGGCPVCEYPEQKVESKKAIENRNIKDGYRVVRFNDYWIRRGPRRDRNPPQPIDNGVLNRLGPW